MDLGLNAAVPARKALRERFQQLISEALRSIDEYPVQDPEGLHRARKNVKRLRSLLRMIHISGLKKERKALNAKLSEAATLLHVFRDNEVLVNFFLELKGSVNGSRSPVLLRALEKIERLGDDLLLVDASADFFKNNRAKFKLILKKTSRNFDDLSLKDVKWRSLKERYKHTRQRMEKSKQRYLKHDDYETLHIWRKQVKHYFYQQLLLQQKLKIKDELIGQVKAVETELGAARDCDLALESLTKSIDAELTANENKSLQRCIQRKRAKHVQRALKMPLTTKVES